MEGRHTVVKPIQVDVSVRVTVINLLPPFLTRPPCAPFGQRFRSLILTPTPPVPAFFGGTGERGPELKLFTECSILNQDSVTQFVTAPPHAHHSNLGYISGEAYR